MPGEPLLRPRRSQRRQGEASLHLQYPANRHAPFRCESNEVDAGPAVEAVSIVTIPYDRMGAGAAFAVHEQRNLAALNIKD